MIVSLGLSAYAIKTSKDVSLYQVEQERLPRVTCLNQSISIKIKRDESGNIYDFAPIEDMVLNVYNVGVGVAQNCKMEWDIDSVRDACIEVQKNINTIVQVNEFEFSNISAESLYMYDYNFEFDDGTLDSIWYYDDYLDDYRISRFDSKAKEFSYILPIDLQSSKEFMKVPEVLAALLLELGNQGITTPISLNLNCYYEDMAGKGYNEKFLVKFAVDETTEEDEEVSCIYDVEINKI